LKFANQGIYSSDLIDDNVYEPPVENEESSAFVNERQHFYSKTTIEKEGDFFEYFMNVIIIPLSAKLKLGGS
jgi:hypothetical protein